MEIKANNLKNGDKGTITHWVNQPDYVGNTIEVVNEKIIMTDKNGFKTDHLDMRFPHLCKVMLKCKDCNSEYILTDTKEIYFDEANIPPEKSGYAGTMSYYMKISISWCMDCGKLLSQNF